MAIPDDKERFTFVIDKDIKAKLQILADRENRKLGNYVANTLIDHIVEYELAIVKKYGDKEARKILKHTYGENLDPEPNTFGFVFYFDVSDEPEENSEDRNNGEYVRNKDGYIEIKRNNRENDDKK